MKIVVIPEVLRAQLGNAAKVAAVDAKSVTHMKPVYSCVELAAADGKLRLRAQSLLVQYDSKFDVEVVEPGAVLVSCEHLLNLFKRLTDGQLCTLSSDGEFLHLKQNEFVAKLPIHVDEFEDVKLPESPALAVSVEVDLMAAIERCGQFVEEERGSSFNGLLLDFSPGLVRVGAFSQSLIHIAHIECDAQSEIRIVLSPAAFGLLSNFDTKDLRLVYADNKVYFASPNVLVRVSCLEDSYPKSYVQFLGLDRWKEGVYPAYEMGKLKEVPQYQLRFKVGAFIEALDFVSTVLGREDRAIELVVKDKLKGSDQVVAEFIGLNRFNKAKACTKLVAVSTLQESLSIGLNCRRLRDSLKFFDPEHVLKLYLRSNKDAVLLLEEGAEHVVVFSIPMRL